ncbi:hypothetical protein [Arthrobacter sp. RIT-PI-e]|uniref:hypothetical protein n=1 Tax=Arthrobacter sp. RIT-PI-e TaxID=1681197 RepID=UPI000ABE34C7|nr:hypothetical protein [Arthrobacter sp. RIT-PI-e]
MTDHHHTQPRSAEGPSRRMLLAWGSAALVAGSVGLGAAPAVAAPASPGNGRGSAKDPVSAASITAAYAFLAARHDQYGTGSTLRLPQSYDGGFFASIGFVSSFTYDNALTILAWLASGGSAELARARVLADTLLYAQDNDPVGDGRTRASYQPDPFITRDGSPQIGSPAANTGNQAWFGMAMAQLFQRTREQRYLRGALRSATWIQEKTLDEQRLPAGYTGGRSGDDIAFTFKATEHNIDIGAFFTMLARVTGDRVWAQRADIAFGFVRAMYDDATGKIWTGTTEDGSTINRFPLPADVQTWASLATGDPRYRRSVSWVVDNLLVTDGAFTGSSYSNADVSKVWFEGSAHLALALGQSRRDRGLRAVLLTSIEAAQTTALNADGRGIVAASNDGLDTGFGDLYYAAPHTGATAWYLMAALDHNPFVLQRK